MKDSGHCAMHHALRATVIDKSHYLIETNF